MKHNLLIPIIFFSFVSCNQELVKNKKVTGSVFGTTYSVIYNSDKRIDFEPQFDSIFYIINKSMSTYEQNSIISKLNRNEDVMLDEHFITVFDASKEIYNSTDGVFDPTIGVLVNAWDFGPEGTIKNLDSLKIKELMHSVGLNNVKISGNKLIKKHKNTYLDFNAIAKGYAVDVISEFLDDKDIANYLVEIGGEIKAQGINIDKLKDWKIGVENPNFDGTQSIFKAISIKNAAMATSGTYRKFKIDSLGNRYAHIIDTKTGYPSETNLLSVSVVTNDCITADAYATAFKAMGIENVTHFLQSHPELKAFLIFENDKGEFETLSLNEFPDN
ncbi:MAG: FAD:protein FMN transferase [Flavobacteriaceae bacterium]|nr:FAD:protein FMN transferase [Flavobacteriaceae bacterium]